MIACEVCHRLRRPNGWHICVPGVRGPTVAPEPAVGHDGESRRLDRPKHISTYRLPGDGPAAVIWNRLVEGKS